MGDYAEYNLYCETETVQKTFFSTTVPTVCPTNAAHTIREDSIYISRTTVPGVTYYEKTTTALTAPCVVGLLPDNQISAGFGLPAKYTFEAKSAAFSASTMVGTTLLVCWVGPMSTPTANNGFVVAATCTVAPNDITYGTSVCFTGTSDVATTSVAVCALSSTDFVIVYRGSLNKAYYVFGAVSGLTVTVGTPVALNDTNTGDQINSIWVGLVGSTMVVAYRDAGNSNKGYWVAATTSGTGVSRTATFGTKVVFNNGVTSPTQYSLCGAVIDSTRFAIFFALSTMSIRVLIGTVSGGTTITAGILSDAIDPSNVVGGSNMAMVNAGTVGGDVALCLFYRRSIDNVSTGSAMVAVCSPVATAAASQTVTLGTSVMFTDAPSMQNTNAVSIAAVGASAGSIAAAYVDASNNNAGKIATLVVNTDGTLTPKQTGFVFNTACAYMSLVLVASTACVVAYRDMLYFNNGSAGIFTVTGSELVVDFAETQSRTPFGIACNAAAVDDIVEVCTGNPNCLTDLVGASTYYAHGDGSYTVSNVATSNLYTPVKLGYATSTTGMILF